jgi:hypothetical protein
MVYVPGGLVLPNMLPRQSRIVKRTRLRLLDGKNKIPVKADNPFPVDCDPLTDLSDPLDAKCASFYQHLIVVMRWMVELGRMDIATKISMLSSYPGCPCEGHL